MTINELLRPTKAKIILFGIFLLILYLAQVQSWTFCKECSPKPILYDIIQPFLFGGLVQLLSMTLLIATIWMQQIPFFTQIFFILQVSYFYVISCVLYQAIHRFKIRELILITMGWTTPFIVPTLLESSLDIQQIPNYISSLIVIIFYGFLGGAIILWIDNKIQKQFHAIPRWVRIIALMIGLTALLATALFLYYLTATSLSNSLNAD